MSKPLWGKCPRAQRTSLTRRRPPRRQNLPRSRRRHTQPQAPCGSGASLPHHRWRRQALRPGARDRPVAMDYRWAHRCRDLRASGRQQRVGEAPPTRRSPPPPRRKTEVGGAAHPDRAENHSVAGECDQQSGCPPLRTSPFQLSTAHLSSPPVTRAIASRVSPRQSL